ncbi:hydrogenase formation protein HypD [Blastopirellula marina]|uniref:Hydrogenase formation protein HypD n=1 Tax=Blastopirellula marina TaxID=124 RepID=A0A2S8F0I2_9BACT|nr:MULTISPECIES: hydrogenase formation protein HypD [Pirellulaceae]PQO25643.1 hydrogenase formation protein HypD [Blastopirellula marina]RCS43326.1 hydrogenase formation protein HypD [Bremerella cremea]
MKYVDEFRDAEACQKAIRSIQKDATQCWSIMEVCGGQTHGLLRWGIDQQLEGTVRLLHGPGCPVCVTPSAMIDTAVSLSRRSNCTVTSFGDMLRVPGTQESLLQARARGADVRLVYSPLDAVRLAKENPHREVIFFAVGFETTAPATALAVKQAAHLGLTNFSLLVAHVRVLPAMEMIASETPMLVNGFLAAGHVCTVTGFNSYEDLAASHRVPVVVTGFEPLDLLRGIQQCVTLLECDNPSVVNCYERCVNKAGNPQAIGHMEDVFEVSDREWRGFGLIANGGLALKKEWAQYDAALKYSIGDSLSIITEDCPAGQIMTGRMKPVECPFFGRNCTPEKPMGAPMVSSEGACAAYFRYLPANHIVRTSK